MHKEKYVFGGNWVQNWSLCSSPLFLFLFSPSHRRAPHPPLEEMEPEHLLSLQSPTVGNTVGAALLGVVGASFLFGVTCLQTYWYYHSYRGDSPLHKYSVGFLWILDMFHLDLVIHSVYHYVVHGFGDVANYTEIIWSIKLQIPINVVVILVVHSLYASRVWILGGYHHGFLGYMVAFIVAAGFAVGIVLTYYIYTLKTFVQLDSIAWAIYSALGTTTAIDFIITFAMCYYLWKSKGMAARLNSKISIVMQYTLSSGLLTSACSLSAMFSYLLLPDTFVYLALSFLLTKLYVGSFLAMLNARERPRQTDEESTSAIKRHRLKLNDASLTIWSPTRSYTRSSSSHCPHCLNNYTAFPERMAQRRERH